MSKIVKLEAENVKRIRAVTIEPKGAVVTVGGKNGQGKTSTLDSIMFAIGGKKTHAKQVVRRGEKNARVTVELDNGLTVERTWKSGDESEKSEVTVRSKDGGKYSSPQKMLDGLFGELSFDPLSFLRSEPAKQVDAVRKLVHMDFTEHDAKRRAAFDERTEVNRELEKVRAVALEDEDLPPVETVDVSALLAEHQQMATLNTANEAERLKLKDIQQRWSIAKRNVEDAAKELAEAQRRVAATQETLAAVTEEGKQQRAKVDVLKDPDFSDIQRRMAEAEATNATARAYKVKLEKHAEAKTLKAKSDALTQRIEELDAAKSKTLAEAKFPVPGLGFGEDGLTLNGLPLEQASSAEQLRVSLAMGLALNPELKVLLIRDGSLLDENSMRLVAEMAEAAGAQVWVEVVSERGDVSVVIEDGEVAAVAEGAAA